MLAIASPKHWGSQQSAALGNTKGVRVKGELLSSWSLIKCKINVARKSGALLLINFSNFPSNASTETF